MLIWNRGIGLEPKFHFFLLWALSFEKKINLMMLVHLFSTPFWIRFTRRSYHDKIVVVTCSNHVSNHVFKVFITRVMSKQDILRSMLTPQTWWQWIHMVETVKVNCCVGFKPFPQLNTSYLLLFSVDFFLMCWLHLTL